MNKIRKLIALLLLLAMALSLAACGGTSGNDKDNTKDDPQKANVGKNEEKDTPEFAYKAEYKRVENNNNYINANVFTDQGFYFSTSEVVGQRELREGETLDWEGQLDIYAQAIYFMDYQGNMRKLEGFDGTEYTNSVTEDGRELYGYINNMAVDANGNLVVLASLGESWSDATDAELYTEEYYTSYHYKQSFYLKWLDATGAELSSVYLGGYDDSSSDTYFYVNNIALADNGMAVACTDNGVIVYNPDGTEAFTINTDYYPENLLTLKDGSVAVMMWGDNGYKLQTIDFEARDFGEQFPMPNDAWNIIIGGGDYDFYYNTGSTVYGYKVEEEVSEKIFKWLDMDINGNNMNSFFVLDDGSVFSIENEWDSDYENVTTNFITITKVPYDSVPHKQELTFATMFLDGNVQNAIIKFNRSHDTIRIDVTDYSEYNTEEDYEAGQTKLNTEILTGNAPDLIDLSYISVSQLAAKGLVEDLYPYLDADPELSRDDFLTNILDAFSIDGKLYQTCSGFYIQTLMGARSIVGDDPYWTYNDVYAALEQMPAGCDILDYYSTQEDVLRTLLSLEVNNLVDWSTGECRFDSQDFLDMLNFAKHFQSTFDWDNYEWTEEDNTENRIMSGKQMLMSTYVSTFEDMFYNDYYFGNEAVFKGYPTSQGAGHMLGANSRFAMSSKCENKDAAWEFLRIFFTEDYQKDGYDLPTNKKVFDQRLEKAMTPEYERDMDGNVMLDENGEPIKLSRGGMGTADGSVIEFYELSQDQADRLLALVNSIDRVASDGYDSFADIVVEQAQAFFAGQKSAEEVAKLIQNKATILVNEQR